MYHFKLQPVLICLACLVSFSMRAQDAKMDAFVSALLKRMTVEEKIGQLNLNVPGYSNTGIGVNQDVEGKIKKGNMGGLFGLYAAPDQMRKTQDLAVKESRLHIPLIFGLDVIHGHRTIFPIPLGLSCTWDMNLIEKTARIAATEATAEGICWAFSPMVDIARDPRWGRISEGSGEDPYLGSLIAKAMVKGYQGDDLSKNNTLMACVKHYALYGGAEAGRDYNTVDMSPVKMHEFYLPPYKAAIDAGVGSIMTSFNEINGVPATGNRWLLTDLLRRDWGFKGLVVTDYTAVNEMTAHGMGDLKTVSALALHAGVDMDMVGEGFLTTLKQSLQEGKITEKEIDQACRRVLEAKYKLGLFDDPYRYISEERGKKEVFTEENRKVAREAAAHSIVLLKNAGKNLPLKKTGTIALIGPLADNRIDMVGTWVIAGKWQDAVSVREGIQKVAGPGLNILYAKGANITNDTEFINRLNFFGNKNVTLDPRSPEIMLNEAVETAMKADVVVAVLGESQSMTGESSSRADIGIPDTQQDLLKALVKTGKPIVLVVFSGRPLTLTWEDAHVPAILETWAGGTEAGSAIADVLFGQYNPAGKLTTTFPRSVGQIPLYYNHKNTGRPYNPKEAPKFKSDYLDITNDPLYPFGYGLSYTTFSYSDLKLDKTSLKGNETLKATVTVTNNGKFAGEEVVQLYISDPVASIARPVEDLKGFKKLMLQPGEHQDVTFSITPDDLKFYNPDLKYDWEGGSFIIHIGTNSRDVKSAEVQWAR